MAKYKSVILLCCPMLASPLLADNIDDKTGNDSIQYQVVLDEFVVQTFKQDRELSLSPVAASTVTSSQLKNKNINDIKAVSAFIPNFYMPDYGSKLTSPVYIRGIGSKINSPSVGMYVDDIPYFEKAAFDFDISEIERIEVLRGPQGTLYGRNTMGGLIKMYTRSPLKYQGTNINASAGSYLTTKVGISHYGKAGDDFGYAVTANYNHSNGYLYNQARKENADKYNSASARVRLEWLPKDNLELRFTSVYDFTDQNGYPYAEFDAENGSIGTVNYNSGGIYKRNMVSNGFMANYNAGKVKFSSQTSMQYVDDHQGIDQDFTSESVYYAQQMQKQLMFSEELNVKSVTQEDDRYKWLFGAFAFWQGIDNTVRLDMLKKNISTEKYYDQPTYGVAFYHQSEFRNIAVDGLSLILGLRYDLEWANMDYSGVTLEYESNKHLDDFKPFNSKLNFGQFTPKVALQYEFESSGIIYMSAAKGYKTGGFNTSFETEEQRTFRPEFSWNYEVGAKHPFFDNRMSAEIALFFIDWKKQQISQPLPSGQGSMLTNAGRSQSKGVEFSLSANIFNGLMFNTAYGYTHARFMDYKNGSSDYSGNRLPFVPEHTFTAGVNYSIAKPCNEIDRINIGVDYLGNGRIYWREDNKTSQPFYGLVNTKVSVMKGAITTSLWAKNITSTSYTTFYFESGGKKLAQKGKPFSIGADIQISF